MLSSIKLTTLSLENKVIEERSTMFVRCRGNKYNKEYISEAVRLPDLGQASDCWEKNVINYGKQKQRRVPLYFKSVHKSLNVAAFEEVL